MPLLMRAGAARGTEVESGQAAESLAGTGGVRLASGGIPKPRRAALFPQCANPRCGSGRFHLWRRREAPIFEGGWCCSAECMAALVEAALLREMDAWSRPQESYRHRIPLGLAMLQLGWISQADLRSALAAQRAAGEGRLGYWLVRRRAASEGQVTRALGLQWSCPVLALEPQSPESLTPLLPRLFVDAYGVLPLRVASGKILYLGFEDRMDATLALAVERMTGLRVESGLVEESLFRPAHRRMLEAPFPQAELMEATTIPALAAAFTRAVERTCAAEARLARVHDCLWLRLWKHPQTGPLPDAKTIFDLIASTGAHGNAN
jgi:hypothetical protein